MINKFKAGIHKLPSYARTEVEAAFVPFIEKLSQQDISLPDNPEFFTSAPTVWYCSQFVAESCMRSPEMLIDLMTSGDLLSVEQRSQYADLLCVDGLKNELELMVVLRKFRRREMVRIAWRDLAGWADLNETLCDLTALAETCIQTTLDFLYQHQRHFN